MCVCVCMCVYVCVCVCMCVCVCARIYACTSLSSASNIMSILSRPHIHTLILIMRVNIKIKYEDSHSIFCKCLFNIRTVNCHL